MITTTLNQILKHNPCGKNPGSGRGWDKLLSYLNKTKPDDEPLSLLTILESNGLTDALWSLRTIDGYDREIRLLACQYACHTLSYYEKIYPGDMRPRKAIEIASLRAEGLIEKEDADAAYAAAYAAARAAAYAYADVAAAAAARAAAHAAAYAVARAADADADAYAYEAVAYAAYVATDKKEYQKQEFILMITQGHEYMTI